MEKEEEEGGEGGRGDEQGEEEEEERGKREITLIFSNNFMDYWKMISRLFLEYL